MHLTRMRFGNVPPFGDPIDLMFDPQVNVFIGPNASGKSRLLSEIDKYFNESTANRQLATHEQSDLRLTFCEEVDYFDDWTKGKNLLCADEEFANAHFGFHGNQTPPVIYLGPTRIGLPAISKLENDAHSELTAEDSDSIESTLKKALSEPFCGARLKTVVDIMYAKTHRMFEDEKQSDLPIDKRRARNFLYIHEVYYSCAKSICEELFTSNRTLNYPTGLDVEYISDQPLANLGGISINRMLGISTNDTPNVNHLRPEERPIDLASVGSNRIYVGDLSSGSQSVLLWILWLALKMLNHYELANGWAREPAIILIDEIENHLHPTWQRRVIPALLEHFPGLQIFATTHSPFVVAGLKAGQVHVLKRDENGVVTASTEQRDVIGWTADEILRGMMGVDEPTDQLTVDRAKRLRELREKENLTEVEEEELNRLRRQVNSDLLSKGGLLESQKERYADLVQDFLRIRQNELNQDGE